jgi:rhamnogalacturonyl hydrolase YesR
MAGGIEITTYCGHFGLAFPCYEMAAQFGDGRAKRIVTEVADIILHRTARNRFGMVGHDDTADFAIPDTTYFVVSPLMLAAALDPARAAVYREQAHYQLRTSIDTFLARDTGLAKTVLLKDGIGKTYWTRASGWLLWAMGGMLRHLPESDPRRRGYVEDMRRLVEGVRRVQDAGGGFHVHMDDPRTPLETTGAAMFAMGAHEGVRRGWLPASVSPAVDRAWKFVTANITPEGKIRRAYTGWAIPAERGEMTMDHVEMGWIPGFILSAACEMTT